MQFYVDQEMLDCFLEESVEISRTLRICLDDFSATQNPKLFEQYGQNIDRIMGTAKSMGFSEIGEICDIGKELGYKSSQVKDLHKQISLQSLLSQLLKELDHHLTSLKEKTPPHPETADLLKKVREASEKLGNLRKTVS